MTGYWQQPTASDTGLGLHALDAPERLVDTTTDPGTGTCDGDPCGRLVAFDDVTIDVTGQAGVPAGAQAVWSRST